jgi:hypothetical protein
MGFGAFGGLALNAEIGIKHYSNGSILRPAHPSRSP